MTAPTGAARNLLNEQRAQMIAERKEKRAFIAAINGASWGTALTALQVHAFAEFMRRFRLDISEIDNLGGRPYRNGRYYMRKTAELVARGRVEWYRGDHIGPDARLARLEEMGDEEAAKENRRRMMERIRFAVPEDATHAYVLRVKIKELAEPVEACKWYIPGRKKKVWKNNQQVEVNADPVGDENPITSVETRAWRRCGRLYAAEIPELYEEERLIEGAAESIEAASVAEAEAADAQITAGPKPVATQGRDAYDESPDTQKALGEGDARHVEVAARETARVHRTPDFTMEDDD